MARKNNRMQSEYHRSLGFDPKKYTTASTATPDRIPQRYDIWFANLGCQPDTSVQGGTRPVVILSNDIGNVHAETLNVVPMTRHLKKPDLPCHTQLDPDCITDKRQPLETSMVLAEQLTTISKKALRSYAGHIADENATNRIEAAVTAQLGLE